MTPTTYEIRDTKRRLKALYAEFHAKVDKDLSMYVLVAMKPACNRNVDEVVVFANTYCEGFEAYKEVRLDVERVHHVCLKFVDGVSALKAKHKIYWKWHYVDGNRQVYPGEWYYVETVDVYLRKWYYCEMISAFEPWSTVIVDYVTHTTCDFDPLSKDAIQSLLCEFGDAIIPPYDPQSSQYVRAIFSSMAEALGACITVGRWLKCTDNRPLNSDYYRIRILVSTKETELLRWFLYGEDPREVFQLEYFLLDAELEAFYQQNMYNPPPDKPKHFGLRRAHNQYHNTHSDTPQQTCDDPVRDGPFQNTSSLLPESQPICSLSEEPQQNFQELHADGRFHSQPHRARFQSRQRRRSNQHDRNRRNPNGREFVSRTRGGFYKT